MCVFAVVGGGRVDRLEQLQLILKALVENTTDCIFVTDETILRSGMEGHWFDDNVLDSVSLYHIVIVDPCNFK